MALSYLLCAFRVYLYRNAYISLQVWASGLWASVFGESVLPEGINFGTDIWETVISIEHSHSTMIISELRCCLFSLLQGSPGTIASEGSDIPRVHWTSADRLY